MKKKIAAVFTALAMTAGTAPLTFAENTVDVVVSVEKFTLGAGYILEPEIVTVNEGASAADAIFDAFEKYGIEAESKSYLSKIADSSTEVDIPQVLTDALGGEEKVTKKADESYLQLYDYSEYGGWMYTVNNAIPSVGMADYMVSDSDVIRVQYSVYGWGEDLAAGASWGYCTPLEGVEFANKDVLISEIAMLRASYDDETLKSNSIYSAALAASAEFGAAQAEVDAAAEALLEADFEAERIDVRTPYLNAQAALRGTEPKFGSEWNVIAAARGEYPNSDSANSDYYSAYLASVENTVKTYGGLVSENSSATDLARTIIAVTASGMDARNIAGYNLFDRLADF